MFGFDWSMGYELGASEPLVLTPLLAVVCLVCLPWTASLSLLG